MWVQFPEKKRYVTLEWPLKWCSGIACNWCYSVVFCLIFASRSITEGGVCVGHVKHFLIDIGDISSVFRPVLIIR